MAARAAGAMRATVLAALALLACCSADKAARETGGGETRGGSADDRRRGAPAAASPAGAAPADVGQDDKNREQKLADEREQRRAERPLARREQQSQRSQGRTRPDEGLGFSISEAERARLRGDADAAGRAPARQAEEEAGERLDLQAAAANLYSQRPASTPEVVRPVQVPEELPEQLEVEPADPASQTIAIIDSVEATPAFDTAVAEPPDAQGDLASQLIQSRDAVAGLAFQEAAGYWANTYVPGDPALRMLETRLRQIADRPDEAARQYVQPFDMPRDAALAVYMRADKRYVAGDTRLLLQVGLQGTRRKSGLRPSMNIGVVLDLRHQPGREVGAGLRAVVLALARLKQTGDRFSVTVAGRPGGVLLPPEEFKYGPVTVALSRLFSGAIQEAETLDLVAAASRAVELVAAADDPDSALGASAVLLVTPSRLGSVVDELERLAHTSAVGGIPTSVVAVGERVDLGEIDRITLAGQGNRRLLPSPDDAERLVDRELHSVSRAVARAVRLRIRLSPGVKLVEMLGSYRLDEESSERVREAEQSVDLRLARNLGIEADRGEDEEGMQLVIPAYYAGDAHVFLLDVVAERPGSIADVTVRYKDLVYLRNGVARANLSLGGIRATPGPLEHNVRKNFVAMRLGTGIREAARLVERHQVDGALDRVRSLRSLVSGLRNEVPEWRSDPELRTDIRMLDEYLGALQSAPVGRTETLQELSDSMRWAGHNKVQNLRR